MTVQMRRGVPEVIANAVSAGGVVANDFRLPAEYMGARMSIQYNWSAGVTAGVADIQVTLDGVNWTTGVGAAAFDTNTFVASTNVVHVLITQGILGIRVNISTAVVGGTVTVLALAR